MQMIPHRSGAQCLPPAQASASTVPASGTFVGAHQLLDRAESTDRQRRAESPRLDAQPAEVLEGVAPVGELPVEDGPDALGADDEVAVAEVPVHHRLGRTRRTGLGQPPQSELEGGMRLAQSVEQAPQLLQQGHRRPSPGISTGVDAMDGGQGPTALLGQDGTCLGQMLVAQDAARDGLPLDELHDHEGGAEPGGLVPRRDHDWAPGTPARAAACRSAASSRSPDTGAPGGSRRNTSLVVVAAASPSASPASRTVKLHVSREAPPGSRVTPSHDHRLPERATHDGGRAARRDRSRPSSGH